MNTDREISNLLDVETSVLDRLRSDIIQAKLPPGQKLKVELLKKHYGASSSPLREALHRLTAEGFVDQQNRRGFRVAKVSLEELEELTRTRQWIEQLAIRESLKHGDVDWEVAVTLAYRRLVNAPEELTAEGKKHPVWLERHRDFHAALLSACPSRPLLNFASLLFDSAARYRELAASTKRRSAHGGHAKLMEAALDRDIDQATALIASHIGTTAEWVVDVFY